MCVLYIYTYMYMYVGDLWAMIYVDGAVHVCSTLKYTYM